MIREASEVGSGQKRGREWDRSREGKKEKRAGGDGKGSIMASQ